MAMLAEADIARSFLEHLRQTIGAELPIHVPGEMWSSKPDAWVEPRIIRHNRTGGGGPQFANGQEYPMILRVRCIVQSANKGTFGTLEELVDHVRPAVDYTAGCRKPVEVRDKAGEKVGELHFREADTANDWDIAVTVGGLSTPACDVATLTVVVSVQRIINRHGTRAGQA